MAGENNYELPNQKYNGRWSFTGLFYFLCLPMFLHLCGHHWWKIIYVKEKPLTRVIISKPLKKVKMAARVEAHMLAVSLLIYLNQDAFWAPTESVHVHCVMAKWISIQSFLISRVSIWECYLLSHSGTLLLATSNHTNISVQQIKSWKIILKTTLCAILVWTCDLLATYNDILI